MEECVHGHRCPRLQLKNKQGHNSRMEKVVQYKIILGLFFIAPDDLLKGNLSYWTDTKCGMVVWTWVKLNAPKPSRGHKKICWLQCLVPFKPNKNNLLINIAPLLYTLPTQTFKSEWVSDCCLTPANSTIFQLYHCKNKLIFNEMMMKSALY